MFSWKKINSKKNINLLVALIVAIFVVVFTLFSFGRHDALKSYLNDLGTYDQLVWNLAHGNFFEASVNMTAEKNFLAAHFSPILAIFIPFYLVFPSPKWLLFFQALAVGLSAIPIYLLAKEKLKSNSLGIVFLASYLLYPALHNGLLYDFHEVVFATVFASFAFYFLEKGADKKFIFFSVLLALSQEHLSLLVFMMGLYLVFIKKRWKFGSIISLSSLAYFILTLSVFMPFFSSGGSLSLLESIPQYPSRYAWLGSTLPEIMKNIISHPFFVLETILSPERLKYLFLLIAPVFSLALYAWPIAIIIPLIMINLLSFNSMTFDILFYHGAIFAPFIFYSAIFAFARLFLKDGSLRKIFAALILASGIISSIMYSVSPLSFSYAARDYWPSKHAKKISEVKKIIPGAASLSVQHNLGPHFSHRRDLYRFPIKKDEARYVLVDETSPYSNDPKGHKFIYAIQEDISTWKADIENLRKSSNYDILYEDGGYILFKKNGK